MKVKINKTEEQEVEPPVYVNYGGYAKVEEDKVLFVDEASLHLQQYGSHMIDHFLSVGRPVERACFENAFQKALSKFNALDFEMSTTKATDEDIREKMVEEFGHEAKQFEL